MFVVAIGLVPRCEDDQTYDSYLPGTVDSVAATSTATEGSVAASSELIASTQPSPTDETIAEVLAATANVPREMQGNSYADSAYFTTVYVVERLGEADDVGFITFSDTAPLITDAQRCAIEAAFFTVQTVVWVHDLEAVIGTEPPVTVPDRHAVLRNTRSTRHRWAGGPVSPQSCGAA